MDDIKLHLGESWKIQSCTREMDATLINEDAIVKKVETTGRFKVTIRRFAIEIQ